MNKFALDYLLMISTDTISRCNPQVMDYILGNDIARSSERFDPRNFPFHDFENLQNGYMYRELLQRYSMSPTSGVLGIFEVVSSGSVAGVAMISFAVLAGVDSYIRNRN